MISDDPFVRRVIAALELFERDPQGALAQLQPLYDREVTFVDPIREVRGLDAFLEMNRRLVRRSRGLAFHVRSAARSGDEVFLAWRMDYRPRLGPRLRFEGTSLLRLRGERVTLHRDFFDLVGPVLDAAGPAGRAWRALVGAVA